MRRKSLLISRAKVMKHILGLISAPFFHQDCCTTAQGKVFPSTSDEPELEFYGSSRAEL